MPKYQFAQIYKIAETKVDHDQIQQMLNDVGAPDWYQEAHKEIPDAQYLVELAGRMCYKSFNTAINKNLTRIRDNHGSYIQNILKSKHGSVIEHASVTFALLGVSRIFTHELVRHRQGTAFSQESMRFVRLDSIRFYYPNSIPKECNPKIDEHLRNCEVLYQELTNELLSKPDMPFSEKKKITSAIRRIIPDGILTDIVLTANHRAWRHMIEVRTSEHAEEELRYVFKIIALILSHSNPALYQDMQINENNACVFENSKI